MSRLSARFLRAFSLVVTDRRWAAPMTASALGLGLFIGVAIGPNAAGTLAGAPRLIELVEPASKPPEPAPEPIPAAEGPAFPVAGAGVAGAPPVEAAPPAPAPPAPGPAPAPADHPRSPAGEAPPPSEGTELEGVVVHANPLSGAYALALTGGELVSVHARELPVAGARLSVETRRLANGSLAELHRTFEKPRASSVSFRGVVTWVGDVPVISRPYGREITGTSPTSPAYTVSGRGASVLVRVPAGEDEGEADGEPELPEGGAYVTVGVEIERLPEARDGEEEAPAVEADGESEADEPVCESEEGEPGEVDADAEEVQSKRPEEPEATALLWQRELEVEPDPPSTYLELAGTLTAVCEEEAEEEEMLALSADGGGESGADLTLAVPEKLELKLGDLELGDSFLATAETLEDGTLELAGLASDERARGADDQRSAWGDLKR